VTDKEKKMMEELGNKVISELLSNIMEAINKGIVELHDVEIEAEELQITLQPMVRRTLKPAVEVVKKKVIEISKLAFEEPKISFPGRVVEVKMGATKSEGGSRDRVLVLGGTYTTTILLHNWSNPNKSTTLWWRRIRYEDIITQSR
jgi:acetyl-CoA decarbonylase/synthase complex subunit delta